MASIVSCFLLLLYVGVVFAGMYMDYNKPTYPETYLGFTIPGDTAVTQRSFRCLYNQDFTRPIVKVYSKAKVQPNAAVNVDAARRLFHAMSLDNWVIDLLFIPCPLCVKSASQQMQEALAVGEDPRGVSYFNQNQLGNADNHFWIDVSNQNGWNYDTQANVAWIQEAMNTYANITSGASNVPYLGFRTSRQDWNTITDNDYDFTKEWSMGKFYPSLWYVQPNHKLDFNGFKMFGNWSEPLMKTTAKHKTRCSITGDETYYFLPYINNEDGGM